MTSLSQQAWQWLGRELDIWTETGIAAEFWWRDDDAIAPGEALQRLVNLSKANQIPLALAVIPDKCKPELADFLQDQTLVSVIQHGYAHENHAAAGQRKLELGGGRAIPQMITELELGYRGLEMRFAARFSPVLVPPWNRIDAELIEHLPAIGFGGISTMKVRKCSDPAPGLLQVNTHLDAINWRHKNGFIGTYAAIAIIIQHLIAKRTGYRDADEPTGILSHHLVQNDAVWRFTEQLLEFLSNHPAVTWLDSRTIWQ